MVLTVNSSVTYENICIDDIMDVIDSLELNRYSVIILEDPETNDYIQSICSNFQGIVEMRVNNDSGFKHYRAFIPNFEGNKILHINTGLFDMKTEAANLLNTLTVKRIMVGFLNKKNVLTDFHWSDITGEFLN